MLLFFVSTTFNRLGQKNVQNFVSFLEDSRTWYFAFDIFLPLTKAPFLRQGEESQIFENKLFQKWTKVKKLLIVQKNRCKLVSTKLR